jgi:flavodoxin
MKTSIIYNSHSGITKAFAEEMGKFLASQGVEQRVASIFKYDREYLLSADLVLLGCWTSGLMIFAQHPEKVWKKFAREMPGIKGKSIALFTTYKLATGSMFRKMEAYLEGKIDASPKLIKSKSRALTEKHSALLMELIK